MNTEDLDIMMMKDKLLTTVETDIDDLSYYTYTSDMEPSYDLSSSSVQLEPLPQVNIEDK
jgi:hypothetical protein